MTRGFGSSAKGTTDRRDLHAELTLKIVAQIQAGGGDFKMPWHRPGVAFTIPKNALTAARYRGSNILWLWMAADDKKFEHQVWATYKQFQQLGAQVRGGERGTTIVKYGEWVPPVDAGAAPNRQHKADRVTSASTDADSAETGKRLYAKPATVFNIDQVDVPANVRAELLPPETPRPDLTVRMAHVDAFIAAIGAEFREGGQRAFYRHRSSDGSGDFIQMPPRVLFTGTETSTPTEAYESCRCHETIHWAGAEHRLNRKHGERFGDHAYAFEELVAELGAAFLCAELAISNVPRPDHAQYIAGWLTVLTQDARAIFSAASAATTAVEYLKGLQPPTPAPPIGSSPALAALSGDPAVGPS